MIQLTMKIFIISPVRSRLFENFDRIEQQLMARINTVEQMLQQKAAIAKMDEVQKIWRTKSRAF